MKQFSEDIELANRIIKGDSQAENLLFIRFEEKIRYLVRARIRRTVTKADNEEIISQVNQAVLLSLRKNGYKAELNKPLDAYIAGIASNVVAQYFRNLEREIKQESIDYHRNIENPQNVLSDILEVERQNQLKNCLSKLKPKYSEVLVLRYYENKSIEEISKELNLERRRVSERINYAIKLLLQNCSKEKFFQ